MRPRILPTRPGLAAAPKEVAAIATCAPSSNNEVVGSWSFLSEVMKPIRRDRRLNAQNPLVTAATGSAANTSSTDAATLAREAYGPGIV